MRGLTALAVGLAGFGVYRAVLLPAALGAWRLLIERVRDRSPSGAPMPGPRTTFLLGNIPSAINPRPDVSLCAPHWRAEYGDIVQIFVGYRPIVLVLEHDLARRVLNLPERPTAPITTFASWGGRGVIFSEGDFQRRHRRFVVQLMGEPLYRAVVEAAAGFAARDLLPALDAACERNELVDPRRLLTALTASVLMKTCFSVDLLPGAVLPGGITSDEFAEAFAELLVRTGLYFRAPFPFWRLFRTPGFRRLEAAMETVARCERAVLALRLQRRGSPRPPSPSLGGGEGARPPARDFLDALLDGFQDGADMTLEDIRVDVHDLLMAGHETTTSALCFTLAMLARWPEAQEAVRGEVDRVLAGRLPAFEHLRDLVLVECAMKETLRLYPGTGVIFRVAPPGGIELGGYRIPEGRWLELSVYQLHRDPAVFPDPDRYDPRRWLAPDDARDRCWMPFGGGPRLCAGKAFATHEFKTVLAALLQRYEVPVLPPHAGAPPPLPDFRTTLRPREDVAVRLRRRPR